MNKITLFFYLVWLPSLSMGVEWLPEEFKQPSLCLAANDIASYNSNDLKAMRVLVDGADRWLFRSYLDLKEDFSLSPDVLSELSRLNQAYLDNGIQLAMIRIPTRGLVHNDKLTNSSLKLTGFQYEMAATSFKQLNQSIRKTGIIVPDLSGFFSWSNKEKQLFFKRDNHWTPEGAQLASDIIAKELEFLNLPLSPKKFITSYAGLLKKENTPFERAASMLCGLRYPAEYAKALTTSPELSNTEESLFSDSEIPQVFLVGTSFSNGQADYNFVGSLQAATGVEVLNLAVSGGKYYGAMDQYLHSLYLDGVKPKLMLWEMPGYAAINDPLFYRRMIPALYNSCDGGHVEIAETVALHNGINQILINKNPAQKFMKSSDYVLGMKFSNDSIRDFKIRVWYASGDTEKLHIKRSRRIENSGVYFLELSTEQKYKNQHFIAAEIILNQSSNELGSVETLLCQRSDQKTEEIKVAVKTW